MRTMTTFGTSLGRGSRTAAGGATLRSPVGMFMAIVLCLAASLPAVAQTIPWRRANIDLQAANEPLNVFLARIVTWQGISASISATVASGRVNGRFRGPAETIFRDLSDTYGLTWYYDGSTLHIYSLSENESRLLQLAPPDLPRVERILREMRLEDRRFPLRFDPTEGTIYVGGPPKYVEVVAGVVDTIAQAPSRPATRLETRIFPLRHARAGDTVVSIGGVETTVPGVARLLAETMRETATPPQVELTRTLPRTLPGLQGKGLASIGRPPRGPEAGAGIVAAGGAAPANGGGAETASGGDRMVAMRGVPRANPDAGLPAPEARSPSVTADMRTNSVIVRDLSERMAMYADVVKQLDVELPMVDIEATVIDVSGGKSEQLGIDWRAHGSQVDISSSPNNLAGTGRDPRNSANDLLFSNPLTSAGRGLVGTLVLGNERNYLLSRINALSETGDARVAANPRIITLNNHEAVLQSTSDFYVRIAGRDQVDLFQVSTGLTLRVTPTLVEDGKGPRFRLVVKIEDGSSGGGGQVDQIPVVSRQAISTQAVVADGESLLIGGYVFEERRDGQTGVPGLSKLPIIGALFRQSSKEYKRVERMFLITPRAARSSPVQRDAPTP
jgi:type III secretion protein C